MKLAISIVRHIVAVLLMFIYGLLALLFPPLLQNPKQTPPK